MQSTEVASGMSWPPTIQHIPDSQMCLSSPCMHLICHFFPFQSVKPLCSTSTSTSSILSVFNFNNAHLVSIIHSTLYSNGRKRGLWPWTHDDLITLNSITCDHQIWVCTSAWEWGGIAWPGMFGTVQNFYIHSTQRTMGWMWQNSCNVNVNATTSESCSTL